MLAPPTLKRRPATLLELAVLFLPARSSRDQEEVTTRRRVFDLVQSFPGLHQREIARQLDLRASHAEHHLRYLQRAGLVTTIEEGAYRRYYARTEGESGVARDEVGAADKRALALLRQKVPLAIIGVLLQETTQGLGDLAKAVRVSPGTLTYQMKKLQAAGLVLVEQDGRSKVARLADPEGTAATLLRYAPTDDLVAGFEELWDDFGF